MGCGVRGGLSTEKRKHMAKSLFRDGEWEAAAEPHVIDSRAIIRLNIIVPDQNTVA